MSSINQSDDIFQLIERTGALLEGHFLLASGLHSPNYLQSAKILQYPKYAQSLAKQLSEGFQGAQIDLVCAPAIGGIIIGHEVARYFGVRFLFAERDGLSLVFRRDFKVYRGERVLCVEDVITTATTINQLIKLIEEAGATVIGIAAIINRTKEVNFPIKFHYLAKLDIPTYTQNSCPLCKKSIPLTKPGSKP